VYQRRSLFEHIIQDISILDLSKIEDINVTSAVDYSYLGKQAITWCLDNENVPCVAILFSQHVVEMLTTARDKEGKEAALTSLRWTINKTSDPYFFVLRCILSLPSVDVGYRSQAKFGKILFSLIDTSNSSTGDRHVAFCFENLPSMTIHIVQEIDDIFHLCKYNLQSMIEYCIGAAESDNRDKTINFILARPEFLTPVAYQQLTPRFAEMYARGNSIVLRYIREIHDNSKEVQKIFLR